MAKQTKTTEEEKERKPYGEPWSDCEGSPTPTDPFMQAIFRCF